MDDDLKTVDNGACLLPCVLNKEDHLPFIQYKRKKRQIVSFGSYDNSRQTTYQDHCSSPKTTSDAEAIPCVAAAMLEESEPEPVDTTMVPTTSSYTELIKDLQRSR